MITQVVPFLTQADMFDPQTYKELGFKGAAFAISLMLLVFCIIKGHVTIISCGPNEGGIREFFGITLWKVGPGPHLHIAGLFAIRKISLASKQIDVEGEADRLLTVHDLELASEAKRNVTVYDFAFGIKLRVRNTKESIGLRVYKAEDLNRRDGENDEATKQVMSQLCHISRVVVEAGTQSRDIERAIMEHWAVIERKELQEAATAVEHHEPQPEPSLEPKRSTYGYEILSVDVNKLVERPYSEMARAIRASGASRGVVASVSTLPEQRSA